MKVSLSLLATTLFVLVCHHTLHAADAAPATSPAGAGTNVFLDEGDADYEMPKSTLHPGAADDDEDVSTAGTKGDAYDQMAEETTAAPVLDKKLPAKAKTTHKAAAEAVAPAAKKTHASESQVDVAPAKTVVAAPVPASVPAAKAVPKRKTASVGGGFKSTHDGECVMYADADKSSAQVLVVKGAKKLWVEQNGDFFKAFHKKGFGYLPAECFE